MRGTEPRLAQPRPPRRFIPAHAGNSQDACRVSRCIAVHPRACGEQAIQVETWIGISGSSPRMRGTGGARVDRVGKGRFIPAHAGNRFGQWSPDDQEAVHPRACGEQGSITNAAMTYGGSSPRMRGTGLAWQRNDLTVWFIPAHAGNRHRNQTPAILGTVHPRACGEQVNRKTPVDRVTGSSPRMRGTARIARIGGNPFRFIPAHAGNSSL